MVRHLRQNFRSSYRASNKASLSLFVDFCSCSLQLTKLYVCTFPHSLFLAREFQIQLLGEHWAIKIISAFLLFVLLLIVFGRDSGLGAAGIAQAVPIPLSSMQGVLPAGSVDWQATQQGSTHTPCHPIRLGGDDGKSAETKGPDCQIWLKPWRPVVLSWRRPTDTML